MNKLLNFCHVSELKLKAELMEDKWRKGQCGFVVWNTVFLKVTKWVPWPASLAHQKLTENLACVRNAVPAVCNVLLRTENGKEFS